MSTNLILRPETQLDQAAITHVNIMAFGRPEEGRLVENLRRMPEFDPRLSLVAELDRSIIGHALFFPIQIQNEQGQKFPCLSLGPIAVHPDHQKQGIGGLLIEAGHRAAVAVGYNAVVLLGHPEYYPRFGYQPAEQWGLTNPWKITGEPWMAIELVDGALQGKAGIAIYPAAFNEAT